MFSGRGSGWSCWHSKAGMGVEACRQRWSDSVDGTTVWATLRSRGAGPSGRRRRSTSGPERECGAREENAVKRPQRRRMSRRPLPREVSPRSKTGEIMRRDPKRFVGPDGKNGREPPVRKISQTKLVRGGGVGEAKSVRKIPGAGESRTPRVGILCSGVESSFARKGGEVPGEESGESSWWHSRSGSEPKSAWRQKRSG